MYNNITVLNELFNFIAINRYPDDILFENNKYSDIDVYPILLLEDFFKHNHINSNTPVANLNKDNFVYKWCSKYKTEFIDSYKIDELRIYLDNCMSSLTYTLEYDTRRTHLINTDPICVKLEFIPFNQILKFKDGEKILVGDGKISLFIPSNITVFDIKPSVTFIPFKHDIFEICLKYEDYAVLELLRPENNPLRTKDFDPIPEIIKMFNLDESTEELKYKLLRIYSRWQKTAYCNNSAHTAISFDLDFNQTITFMATAPISNSTESLPELN